jgi:hypothetical protein
MKRANASLTTNDVIELNSEQKKRPKLTMTQLDRDRVLMEGNAAGPESLGEFVLAQAGNAWFTRESTLGFYLHKLPCYQGNGFSKKIQKRKRSPR